MRICSKFIGGSERYKKERAIKHTHVGLGMRQQKSVCIVDTNRAATKLEEQNTHACPVQNFSLAPVSLNVFYRASVDFSWRY